MRVKANWCHLQQEVNFFDEIFPERQVASGHIVLDDAVEPSVNWIVHERGNFKAADIQVQL